MDDLVSGCAQNVPTKEAGQSENTLWPANKVHILLWSCRESNPTLYQAKCLLPWRFVTSRSNSVPLVTCGFVFGS
jgi:hypothetical protein